MRSIHSGLFEWYAWADVFTQFYRLNIILGTLLAIHDAELNNVYIFLWPGVLAGFSQKKVKVWCIKNVLVKIFLNFIPFQKLVFVLKHHFRFRL